MVGRRSSPALRLRRALATLAWLLVLLIGARWAWNLPAVQASIESARLARMPAPTSLPVPVEGVAARRIADTWGAARSGGRSHEGVDIFAPRGTPVTSSTRGVVSQVADRGLGGKQVWVIGPGGERHYYAHLDAFAPGLARFDRVEAGALLGFVGDTGNARGTSPHLHYGIYAIDGAYNPWPLLQAQTRAAEANPTGTAGTARANPGSERAKR